MSDCLAGRLGVTPNEIVDEQWNIRRSLAQRWNDNRNNIESVEKDPGGRFRRQPQQADPDPWPQLAGYQ
jgi:hypothetical protein